MKENKQIIDANHFYSVLDCLGSQFYHDNNALCVGDDFGKNFNSAAGDFFSIVVLPEKLPDGMAMIGILADNSVHEKLDYRFTYIIYIDIQKIEGVLFEPFLSILLAHEICHFAFFYELFLKMEGTSGTITHRNLTHALLSGEPSGVLVREHDFDTHSIAEDTHNIAGLIRNMGKYTKEHFTNGKDSNIDYQKLFFDLIDHFKLVE